MRRNLILFLAVILLFGSCKKDEKTLLFEESAEKRMSIKLQELEDLLTEAENGWIGHLMVIKTGGYGFYFEFSKDEKVKMVADLNATTASEPAESTYRLKAVSAPSIIFDTYNYITLLQDPEPGSFGGDPGKGYQSDIEFEYVRSTADSVVLIGKKYRQELVLLRANSDQKAQYLAGDYESKIESINTYFQENSNPYVDLTVGSYASKIQLSMDRMNKRVELAGILEDGEVISSTSSFYYGLDGIHVVGDSLVYQGVNFLRFTWQDEGTLTGYDDGGNAYPLSNSIQPIVPLYKLLGVKYSGLFSGFRTIYPGTSESGRALLNTFHENLLNGKSGYSFNYGTLTLKWNIVNQRMEVLAFHSQNGGGSGWTTSMVYDYTLGNDGTYTFVKRTDPSGGYTGSILTEIHEFFQSNSVSFDYFVEDGLLYGKMTSLNDPSIVMTFLLN